MASLHREQPDHRQRHHGFGHGIGHDGGFGLAQQRHLLGWPHPHLVCAAHGGACGGVGVGMQLLFTRLGIANTYFGVVVAHTIIAIPLVLISVSGALAGIDKRVELAAESLGAGPFTVLSRVTLPLAGPGIISGAVLAFATSLDEVVLTMFVAGPNQRTLARQMFSTIRENISPTIASAAFIFIIATILFGIATVLVKKKVSALKP